MLASKHIQEQDKMPVEWFYTETVMAKINARLQK